MMSNKFEGFLILGGGTFLSHNSKIEVCKTQHSDDYKKLPIGLIMNYTNKIYIKFTKILFMIL